MRRTENKVSRQTATGLYYCTHLTALLEFFGYVPSVNAAKKRNFFFERSPGRQATKSGRRTQHTRRQRVFLAHMSIISFNVGVFEQESPVRAEKGKELRTKTETHSEKTRKWARFS